MKRNLRQTWLHLGLGATAVPQPPFTGDLSWYEAYGARTASDGAEGRLVTMSSFRSPWSMWEMHPKGHEVVVCITGEMTIIQELPSGEVRTTLSPGEYAINEPGVWHTADVAGEATALFITAGQGTEHRPR